MIIIAKSVPFSIETSLNRKSRSNMQTFPRSDVQRNPSIFSHKATNIYVIFLPRWGKQLQKKSDECKLVRVYGECSLNHPHHHFAPPCKKNRGLPQNCSNSPLSNIRATNSQPTFHCRGFISQLRENENFDLSYNEFRSCIEQEYHSVRFSTNSMLNHRLNSILSCE